MTVRRIPMVMIQGTGSHVGKSVLVAGLCRLFARRGLQVRPFKPQNMSNNAAVVDGGEIGRAQALQARAAGVTPTVHMNPVLLKPEGESRAQVVVQGRVHSTVSASEYLRLKGSLLPQIVESFETVTRDADLVIVEGAGSPAETNLRAGDVANMGFAEAVDCPVVLAGDIDRGGVIASLVGTNVVLDPADRDRIKGFIVNKFRGNPELFAGGVRDIEKRTGWPSIGVVPWFEEARFLPAEDTLGLPVNEAPESGKLVVAVPRLPRIANFDDLDPLRQEPEVEVVMVEPGHPIPSEAGLVLLAGSKATMGDLAVLRDQGWDIDIRAHVRRGGRVLGLCGGYQMLGRRIVDPDGREGVPQTVAGLGLLDVETALTGDKSTVPVTGRHPASGTEISGYEIHIGQTIGRDCEQPFVEIAGRPDGAISGDGLVAGTYVHGLFASDAFRRAFLREFGRPSSLAYEVQVEQTLDHLAAHLETHLAADRLLAIAVGGLPNKELRRRRG